MTDLWRETDSGKSSRQALETKWWVLARGDRRGFVAIDSEGGVHSVARRIEGAKAADVRQRFADIDPASLPSVAEAKQVQRERRSDRIQGSPSSASGKDRPRQDPEPSRTVRGRTHRRRPAAGQGADDRNLA